jgi:hypothetical protein
MLCLLLLQQILTSVKRSIPAASTVKITLVPSDANVPKATHWNMTDHHARLMCVSTWHVFGFFLFIQPAACINLYYFFCLKWNRVSSAQVCLTTACSYCL